KPLCRLCLGLCLSPIILQSTRATAADLTIRPSGEHGVRVTLVEKDDELKLNPALVDQSLPTPALRLKAGESKSNEIIGNLVVSVSNSPLTVRIDDANGHKVQELQFADNSGAFTFSVGDAPVLGLGGGAQQFDRRGTIYQVRNGQVSNLPNRNGQTE